MNSTTTAIRELGSCLVCNEPIEANAEVEISDLHLDGTAGTASVKVVGFSVSHDCRTKATADEPTAAAADHECADSCGHCESDIEMARSFNESEEYRKALARETCCRERDDVWVEVDDDTWDGLPEGARTRREWVRGGDADSDRCFVHREDLPDPDTDLVERMARALLASDPPNGRWEGWSEFVQERYRKAARAALAALREGER